MGWNVREWRCLAQRARGDYLMSVGLGRCYPDPSIHLVSAVILCSKLLFLISIYLLFYFLAAPRGLQDLNSPTKGLSDPPLLQ